MCCLFHFWQANILEPFQITLYLFTAQKDVLNDTKYNSFSQILLKMIPLIDCSPIAEGNFEDVDYDDFTKVADELGRAMTGIGMCNLINHGVCIEKVFRSFLFVFFVQRPLIILI